MTLISDEEMRFADREIPLKELPDWQRETVEIAKEVLFTDNYIS